MTNKLILKCVRSFSIKEGKSEALFFQCPKENEVPSSLYQSTIMNPVVLPDFDKKLLFNIIKNSKSKLKGDIQQSLKDYECLLNSSKTSLKDKRKLLNQIYAAVMFLPNCFEHNLVSQWNNTNPVLSENQLLFELKFIEDNIDKTVLNFSMKYYQGKLATLKFILLEEVFDWFCSQSYIGISLSDISKTPVVELCKQNYLCDSIGLGTSKIGGVNSDDIINHHAVQFLTGSASLEAFCSFLMRHTIKLKGLPLKFVSVGNIYSKSNNKLYQSRQVSILVGCKTEEELQKELEELLAKVHKFWSSFIDLQLTAEVLNVDSGKLHHWEGNRYVLQFGGVNLAKVSVVGDYISRRLKILSGLKNPIYMVYAEVFNFEELMNAVKVANRDVKISYSQEWIKQFFEY